MNQEVSTAYRDWLETDTPEGRAKRRMRKMLDCSHKNLQMGVYQCECGLTTQNIAAARQLGQRFTSKDDLFSHLYPIILKEEQNVDSLQRSSP
jgi:hypothetical protein